jgi:hypothetical protein
MERSSRRAASRADVAKDRLTALRDAKATGKKRVMDFELKREEDIYDEARTQLHTPLPACVSLPADTPPLPRSPLPPSTLCARAQLDEKAYANLVAKRRVETGGFIVGDAGGGCVARESGVCESSGVGGAFGCRGAGGLNREGKGVPA